MMIMYLAATFIGVITGLVTAHKPGYVRARGVLLSPIITWLIFVIPIGIWGYQKAGASLAFGWPLMFSVPYCLLVAWLACLVCWVTQCVSRQGFQSAAQPADDED